MIGFIALFPPTSSFIPTGNIRRAEHFIAFMHRFLAYLKDRLKVLKW